LLAACLASVRRHAPAGTEILVVDDGSPEGIAGQVASEIRVLCLPRRRGFCVAANAGMRAASGEIVELLNDDTEVTAGWAEAALAVFVDRSVAAVAPLVLQAPKASGMRKPPVETINDSLITRGAYAPRSPEIIDSAGDRYYLGGIAGKRGHGERLSSAYLEPCRVFGASASSAFYRRDAVLQVGAFPESFGAYFEDVDLAFRLNRTGWQVRYEPASRVFHRGHSSYGRPRRRLLEQQSQNEERVFWRNLPGSALRQALPRHLAVLSAKAWRRWQEGNVTPFLLGRLRAFGELPELIRHRRRLGADSHMQDWQVETRFWFQLRVPTVVPSIQAIGRSAIR